MIEYVKTFQKELNNSMLSDLAKNKWFKLSVLDLLYTIDWYDVLILFVNKKEMKKRDIKIRYKYLEMFVKKYKSLDNKIRIFDKNRQILLIIKPPLYWYWTKYDAYMDVAKENKIVLWDNWGFLNLELKF